MREMPSRGAVTARPVAAAAAARVWLPFHKIHLRSVAAVTHAWRYLHQAWNCFVFSENPEGRDRLFLFFSTFQNPFFSGGGDWNALSVEAVWLWDAFWEITESEGGERNYVYKMNECVCVCVCVSVSEYVSVCVCVFFCFVLDHWHCENFCSLIE